MSGTRETAMRDKHISCLLTGIFIFTGLAGCSDAGDDRRAQDQQRSELPDTAAEAPEATPENWAERRLPIYAPFTLSADLSHLSDKQRSMLVKLIQASEIMDDLFWQQAVGDKTAFMANIESKNAREFARMNYGPWDRLANEMPFIDGYFDKPLGANLYPADMTIEEFNAADLPGKDGLYTLLRRNEKGELYVLPYSQAYKPQLQSASSLLRDAAALADDGEFSAYLSARAKALLDDDYFASDMLWMDMKNNPIDIVIGPIETYEDRLFGYKTAFESYVLLKDLAWSERLSRYVSYLPHLQEGLPVPEPYKTESPGTDSDLNAYDVLYYAGHSNAGAKTIAINLPNDESVQLQKGTRRLQLKNAMQAKFDKIMRPIADELIEESQRSHVTFNAFFTNTMFHEVAHGLGIKNTITGEGTVRLALRELASAMEEGKADVLGVYMITRLFETGEITDGDLMDYYVTFLTGIFRSVRFGASSAHGQANMVRFNFFQDLGAFSRNSETGQYRVDSDRMQESIAALSELILTLQGDGDYDGVGRLFRDKGMIGGELQSDLDRLASAGIPVDVYFIQGVDVLGLERADGS